MQQVKSKPTGTEVLSELEAPNGDSAQETRDRSGMVEPRPEATTRLGPLAAMRPRGLHLPANSETGMSTFPALSVNAPRVLAKEVAVRATRFPSGLRGLLVPGAFIMAALFVSIIGFMSVDEEKVRMLGGVTLVVLCFAMMAGQMYFLKTTLAKYERASIREKALAKASTDLIATRSRESIREVALQAAQALVRRPEDVMVSLLLGTAEQLTMVVATGDQAAEIIGAQIDPGKAQVDLSNTAGTFVVRLLIKEEFAGELVVAGKSAIPEECHDALESLGVNVALALERLALEEEVAYQIFHDPLTGLANRALFLDRLDQALAHFDRRRDTLAVLILDLDDFKVTNDKLGRRIGDQLLAAVAQRIKGCLRAGDTVARAGGDEFVILLNDITRLRDATLVAEQIIEQFGNPFAVAGQHVSISSSVGVAFYAERDGADDLLRNAEAAMYGSKNMGKARYSVFSPHDEPIPSAPERIDLQADLRKAIERGEFTIYYQPVIELETGKIVEMEALVRWEHPKRGTISSAQFIPVAEQTGLIVPIGQWVLEQACKQGKAWQEHYPSDPPLTISVNLSAGQTRYPNLVADLARSLKITGLSPEHLRLEITEKTALEDDSPTVASLRDLSGLGIRLAIDDFTNGQSALKCMKRYPVDTLKLDRSFVKRIARDPEDTGTIHAIIAFAKTMNLRLVAKGIETYEQLTVFEKLGCRYGQGNQLARSMDSAAASVMLSASPRGETGSL